MAQTMFAVPSKENLQQALDSMQKRIDLKKIQTHAIREEANARVRLVQLELQNHPLPPDTTDEYSDILVQQSLAIKEEANAQVGQLDLDIADLEREKKGLEQLLKMRESVLVQPGVPVRS